MGAGFDALVLGFRQLVPEAGRDRGDRFRLGALLADWGEPADPPPPGAIAVWARGRTSPDSPVVTGHVAFFVEDLGGSLLVLGGNQSDRVCLKAYPKRGCLTDTVDSATPVRELYELLGYRWPGTPSSEPSAPR